MKGLSIRIKLNILLCWFFKCRISSNIPGYGYHTDTYEVVFSDDIKTSLIYIMRNIDCKFIITFYTAFVKMLNEGDAIVQSKYEKQLELIKSKKRIDLFHLH